MVTDCVENIEGTITKITRWRNKLRNIARFLVAIREINPNITTLKDAFQLNNVEAIIKAVEKVGSLSEDGTKFRSASTAFGLTLEIKYVITIVGTEYTKNNNKKWSI